MCCYQLSTQRNGALEVLPGIAAMPAVTGMESGLELPRSFVAALPSTLPSAYHPERSQPLAPSPFPPLSARVGQKCNVFADQDTSQSFAAPQWRNRCSGSTSKKASGRASTAPQRL
jgi:hypothetical protein